MTPAFEGLALIFCVLAAIMGAGLRLCDRLRITGSKLERGVWVLSIGLAVTAYLVLAVGSAGGLRKEVFLILLVLFLSLGLRRLRSGSVGVVRAIRSAWASAGWFEKALTVPAAVCVFFALCAALAPPIGQDELCYHLVQPQNYVREGRVYAVPYSVNALWPYLTHMLFTLGLLIQGAEAAKLFHWVFYLLTAAAVGSFVTRAVNGRAGWIAAVCYLVTPAAFTQAGYAYIDHALALYVFLAFYAACVWVEKRSSGWAWLAGIACGSAAAVKLIGLFAVLPVAAIMLSSLRSKFDPRAAAAAALRVAAGAFAAGSVWYIRSWVLTGNPVYPFYPEWFGGNGFEDPTYVGSHGRGTGIAAFLSLPWDVTMHPDWFGGEVAGPLFLACAPLALVWARTSAAVGRAAAALLVYAGVWFIVDPNIRFFFSAFAWSAVLCGAAVDGWRRAASPPQRILLTGLFGALVTAQALLAPYHHADEAALLFGSDRQAYLAARERTSKPAAEINRALGSDAWILSTSEVRGYYFAPKFTLVGDFERMVPEGSIPRDPERLAAHLRSAGFTHVMTAELSSGAGDRSMIERVVQDRSSSRSFFKDELVVRSQGNTYVIYRIL